MKTLTKFDKLSSTNYQKFLVIRPESKLLASRASKVTTAFGFTSSGRNSN